MTADGFAPNVTAGSDFSDVFGESTDAWWWTMIGINLTQAGLLITAAVTRPPRDSHERKLLLLACIYLTGCAWRCTFPVLWEVRPHACLFKVDDSMLVGGELVDQAFSQFAESSIAIMLAIKSARALRLNGSPLGAAIASKSFWLIVGLARVCCWYGCSTDNKLFHVIEESSWTLFACVLAGTGFVSLLGSALQPSAEAKASPASGSRVEDASASARAYMLFVLPIALLYIRFMVMTDVPMYYRAWRDDVAAGTEYPSFVEGLRDLVRCDVVTHNFEAWREAIVWQTGYFGVFPLFCVATFAHRFPLSDVASKQALKTD